MDRRVVDLRVAQYVTIVQFFPFDARAREYVFVLLQVVLAQVERFSLVRKEIIVKFSTRTLSVLVFFVYQQRNMMKWKLLTILSMFTLPGCVLNNKTITIHIKNSDAAKPVFKNSVTIGLKIPIDSNVALLGRKMKFDTFVQAVYHHFPEQFFYDQFRKSELNEFLFSGARDYYSIDTTAFKNESQFDAETIFLVGIRKNDVIIISDNNNNNNLNDDKPIIFKNYILNNDKELPGMMKYAMISKLQGKYYDDFFLTNQLIGVSPIVRLNSANSGNKGIEELSLKLEIQDTYRGRFRIGNKKYQIVAKNFPPSMLINKNNLRLAITRRAEIFDYELTHDPGMLLKFGDKFSLGKYTYNLIALDPIRKKLKITKTNPDSNAINIINTNTISFYDLISKDSISFSHLFSMYNFLLVDFWGSWCAPCLAGMPELIKFSEKNTKGVGLVGIVYDNKDNIDTIMNILDHNKINWPQYFIPMDSSKSIVKEFNVEAFPTYLLINKDGKIIHRDVGAMGFERIKKLLEILK